MGPLPLVLHHTILIAVILGGISCLAWVAWCCLGFVSCASRRNILDLDRAGQSLTEEERQKYLASYEMFLNGTGLFAGMVVLMWLVGGGLKYLMR